jgi:rfaE bifunctional protein kinase chain/domain
MSLSSLFHNWSKNRILVVGDFMLDTYTMGVVKRVSPEAPVMVVNVKKTTKLPGGAGNVALNLAALGAQVSVLGRLGLDSAREDLIAKLKEEKVDTTYLYNEKGYLTPIKNRIMADHHQILRVDFEEPTPIKAALEEKIVKDLPKILKGISTIAISDYAKGFLSDSLLAILIEEANKKNIPVIIDPKGKDFTKYRGAFLIKPNLKEAIEASGLSESTPLDEIAKELQKKTQVPNLMITRSSLGISLYTKEKKQDFPVKVREVVDVTGAGDTVLAVLTYTISSQLSLDQATKLCNLAAGEVIEHLGCARISMKRLAELILSQHLKHKVFTSDYLEVLQFILDHEEFILVKVSLRGGISPHFFGQLKTLREKHLKCKLVAFLEEGSEQNAIIELLGSLSEIDFVVQEPSDLEKLSEKHAPRKIYYLTEDKIESESSLPSLISH